MHREVELTEVRVIKRYRTVPISPPGRRQGDLDDLFRH